MRKLIMKMSMSVDGFVCGPNGENDWIFKSSTPDSRAWALEKSMEAGLIIMGRKSFDAWSSYWPTATGPFATPMNEIPKALFTQQKGFKIPPATSSSLAVTSWAETRVFDGDLVEGIRQLKQEPGKPISAIGGAGFMRSLITTGLIDEYHLAVHPVVLGGGLSIFPSSAKSFDLKLIDTKAFSGGIVAHTYHPLAEGFVGPNA
jgi:dihydrofolate reductase